MEALHDNYTLIDLKLAGNEVDYKTLQEIDKMIRRNYDMMITKQKESDMSHRLKSEISELSSMQNVSNPMNLFFKPFIPETNWDITTPSSFPTKRLFESN